MSVETGRKIVDYLLDQYERNDSDFINWNTRAVVLDFIGGEPLLEATLIEQICDYWFQNASVATFHWLRSQGSLLLRMVNSGLALKRSI